MMARFAPLLLLIGCSAAQAEDPQIAFRECILEQARTLDAPPNLLAARKLGENCIEHLQSLPVREKQELFRSYTCAPSEFESPCEPIIDVLHPSGSN